jgi:cytosine deaminase
VTSEGAKVMELESYGVEVGCLADLLLVPGEALADAIVSRFPNRRVIKRGKIVARDGVSILNPPGTRP